MQQLLVTPMPPDCLGCEFYRFLHILTYCSFNQVHFDTCLLESVHTFEPKIECIAFSEPQGHRNRTVLPSKDRVGPNLAILNSEKLKDEVFLVN